MPWLPSRYVLPFCLTSAAKAAQVRYRFGTAEAMPFPIEPSPFRRIWVIPVAIALANLPFSVVNEVLSFAVNCFSTSTLNRGPLRVVVAGYVSCDFIHPPITGWIWNCVYPITSSGHMYLQNFSYILKSNHMTYICNKTRFSP